jgi:hypothetical protein
MALGTTSESGKAGDIDWGSFFKSLGSPEGWGKKRQDIFGADMQALFGMLANKVNPKGVGGKVGGAFSDYVQGVAQREGENDRRQQLWKAISMMGRGEKKPAAPTSASLSLSPVENAQAQRDRFNLSLQGGEAENRFNI